MTAPADRRRVRQSRRGMLALAGGGVVFGLGLAFGPDALLCLGETAAGTCDGGTLDLRAAGSALAGFVTILALYRLIPERRR